MARRTEDQDQSGLLNGLTPIHRPIHCAATDGSYVNEQDEIDVANFLDTRAEVALTIVARKLAQSKGQE